VNQAPVTHPSPAVLPKLPDWPASSVAIIGAHQWATLGSTLAQLHADHQTMIGQFTTLMGALMSTLADLTAQLDAISASESAEAASLSALGTALGTIISDLQSLPPVGVLTQDQLDAVVQKATDDATAAATNAATGAAESTQASGAATPPAPPAP
jgi:hypothetical protein